MLHPSVFLQILEFHKLNTNYFLLIACKMQNTAQPFIPIKAGTTSMSNGKRKTLFKASFVKKTV
jgi:hypothetical protein